MSSSFAQNLFLHDLQLFLQGHEGRYTIYVHASREKPEHVSPIFVGREVHSEKVMIV
jgi:hypothetical protein